MSSWEIGTECAEGIVLSRRVQPSGAVTYTIRTRTGRKVFRFEPDMKPAQATKMLLARAEIAKPANTPATAQQLLEAQHKRAKLVKSYQAVQHKQGIHSQAAAYELKCQLRENWRECVESYLSLRQSMPKTKQ